MVKSAPGRSPSQTMSYWRWRGDRGRLAIIGGHLQMGTDTMRSSTRPEIAVCPTIGDRCVGDAKADLR